MVFFNTLYNLLFITTIVLLFLWIRAKRKQTSSKVTGKIVLYSLAATLVLGATTGVAQHLTGATPTESTSESSSKPSSSSSTSSSDEDSDVLKNLSSKELKEYNSGLVDSLSEEQQWASDGNDKYNSALYIDNLKYDSGRGLLIYVSDDFNSLRKDDKTTVANHAQKMANTQITILGKEAGSEPTPNTNVYYGSKKLGRSTMFSNNTEFKWFKN